MNRPSAVPSSPDASEINYTGAQKRIIAAAFELFADKGVAGTSLKMIADALGVTKAAVYHKFPTKDAIVLAVAEFELRQLRIAVQAAESHGYGIRAREILLTQIVDLAVQRRRLIGWLQSDPVMVRFLAEHEPFQEVIERVFTVLAGPDADSDMRIHTALLSAAIGGAAMHPVAAGMADDTLRRHLMKLARKLFTLDPGHPASSAGSDTPRTRRAARPLVHRVPGGSLRTSAKNHRQIRGSQ